VFSYTKQNFHITSASASNGYLVLSRLPYDVNVLKLMDEAKKLKKQNDFLKVKDERHKQEKAKLIAKNRLVSDKLNATRREVSSLRDDARIRALSNSIFDDFRTRDPVDLFVFDAVIKAHVHVLEYHKPADHVDLKGRVLRLWDKKTGYCHSFNINMHTKDVCKYDVDKPIQPERLCDLF